MEQVFVRRRAGNVEVSFVLENPAGARTRETLPTPMSSTDDGVRFAARSLARRGLQPTARLRLRIERDGGLADDDALRDLFLTTIAVESGGSAAPEGSTTWRRD